MRRLSIPNAFLLIGSVVLVSLFVRDWTTGGFSSPPSPSQAMSASPADTPYKGAIQPSPSSIYVTINDSTIARVAPSVTAATTFTVPKGSETLTAIGQVVDDSNATFLEPTASRTWVAVKSPTNNDQTGFIRLSDLITPKQIEWRKQAVENVMLFQNELNNAKASKGEIRSGIYSINGICNDIPDNDFGSQVLLQSMDLIWLENETKLHFVNAASPSHPIIYDIDSNGRGVDFTKYGHVTIRSAVSSVDKIYIGYKDGIIFYKDADGYRLMIDCGRDSADHAIAILKKLAEDRPPEEKAPTATTKE